ncbi:unnamed protein product [Ranitomeya imitator]|uniref:WAP domain-containing protein n=1 Tax=Ranitomeya imitator TaxID=111125 RepID=A0ABN9M6S6_9NEOB|nr:unnamed protein product [Ranitomeya imitator]
MGRSMMLVVLVLFGILASAISQELEEASGAAKNIGKPGRCPEVVEEDLISSTSTPCSPMCKDKESCTTQACDNDFNCEGSLKCCKARCATECLPPVFRSPCENNFDCPWTLKCCSGVCDSDCVYQHRKPDSIAKGIILDKKKE